MGREHRNEQAPQRLSRKCPRLSNFSQLAGYVHRPSEFPGNGLQNDEINAPQPPHYDDAVRHMPLSQARVMPAIYP